MTHEAVLAEWAELSNGLVLRVQGPAALLACRPGQVYLLRCGPSWSPYLRRAGAIFAHDLNPQKARVLLMVGLGAGYERTALDALFV